jgi:Tol biopolymer transport system component
LQRALDASRKAAGSPGAQAAVVFSDGASWDGASGLADVENNKPVTEETRFAMGSMMKLHTSVLMLLLQQEGTLSLDDVLSRWVPGFPGAKSITLRQLLLHTSGLAKIAGSDLGAALAADRDHHLTYDELILEPVCAPGACYHYQSPDYDLIGAVVEKATGDEFVDAVTTRLWERMGLAETYFPSQESPRGPMATGYAADRSAPAAAVAGCEEEDVELPYPCAGGGLLTTASDAARFTANLFTGDLLEPESREQLLDFGATSGLPGISECGAVGLGLVRTGTQQRGEAWAHGGFTGTFHSSVLYYPRYDVTVAVAVNDDGDTGAITSALADVALAEAEIVDDDVGSGFCNYDVYLARRDGSDRSRLTDHPGGDGSTITWSPDGQSVAFGTTRTGNAEIFVMNADGTHERNLTNHPAQDRAATWSPDGESIAFHSDRLGTNDIYVMDADGSNVTPLTSGPRDDLVPSWSPDGSRIAFARGGDARTHDIYVMNADGSNQKRLTDDPRDEWWPAWSPDGSRIAFVPDRRVVGGGGVAIVEVATGTVTTVDLDVDGPNFPAWSSSGRLAFVDFPGDLWTAAPDGSGLRRVTRTGEREYQPAWSPDSRWIAFPGERWVEGSHASS